MELTGLAAASAWLGLVTTVVVMLAVVAAILVFERRRAREIENDLRQRPEHPRR